MNPPPGITFRAVLQRTDPKLPVYIVVPHALVAPWRLQATTVVERAVNGHALGRRTIKRWDSSSDANWFVELTTGYCSAAGIEAGDELDVSLSLAVADVPQEVQVHLDESAAMQAAWDRVPASKQRAAMEHIRGGKSLATRERRAALVAAPLKMACE